MSKNLSERLLSDLVNGSSLLYSSSLEAGASPAFLRHLSVACYHLQRSYDIFVSCSSVSSLSYSEFLRRCFSGIESKK